MEGVGFDILASEASGKRHPHSVITGTYLNCLQLVNPRCFPSPCETNSSLLPLPLFSVEGTFQLPLDLKVT